MTHYVGVDWATRGWLAVTADGETWDAEMHPSMHSVWFTHRDADSILVDIPIGLPEAERRECDREAKEQLDGERARSVFWTPCRAAVEKGTYEAAKAANQDCRGDSLSSQAWGLIPRIQEVDRLLRDDQDARDVILESHPEVCFDALHDSPLPSKHDDGGLDNRVECLESYPDVPNGTFDRLVESYIERPVQWARRIGSSNKDDLLDAMALALTAKRADGDFARLPDYPPDDVPRDAEGLPMQIVYDDS